LPNPNNINGFSPRMRESWSTQVGLWQHHGVICPPLWNDLPLDLLRVSSSVCMCPRRGI
jgi:hypothetical protein